jgi:mono/diheme cytochrome c family protein
LFAAVCSTCHGVDASGIAEMGKDLRKNGFVAKSTIPEIVKFIHTGHPPTPQFPEGMPAGGDAPYDDAQLADIAAWLKSLQGTTP